MKSYCVKEKRQTMCVPGTEQTRIASNGRKMMVCKCSSCGITKTQFLPGSAKQTGGARVKGDYTCGLDPNKKPFSMQKCLDMHQVRYWGKKKIDPRILRRGANPDSAKEETRKALISQRITLMAAIKKLSQEKKYYGHKRTPEQLAEINEKGQDLVKKLKAVNVKIDKVEAQLAGKKKTVSRSEPKFVMPKLQSYDDPELDARYKQLVKAMKTKPKKEENRNTLWRGCNKKIDRKQNQCAWKF